MKKTCAKHGFTLVEILIAMAIITGIFVMVYGSYHAISKSAGMCNKKIAILDETRDALAQMARQISCSYPGRNENEIPSAKAVFKKDKKNNKKTSILFEGNCDGANGQMLHFVTTTSAFQNQQETDGLFEVIYRFDRSTGQLLFSQKRFIDSNTSLDSDRFWLPIISDVTAIELAFYDGREWLEKWDIREKPPLPYVVKVDITIEHKNFRPYHYATFAPVYCQVMENNQNKFPELASANTQ